MHFSKIFIILSLAFNCHAALNIKLYIYGSNLTDVKIFGDNDLDQVKNLSKTYYDLTRKTYVYVPSIGRDPNQEEPTTIIGNILKLGSFNMIAVDWSQLNLGDFSTSLDPILNIANALIDTLLDGGLVDQNSYVIACGYGTMLGSYFGKYMSSKGKPIKRLTALNPCKLPVGEGVPDFTSIKVTSRDARFVDVIFTEAVYSDTEIKGHANFWVDGYTTNQPGCTDPFCNFYRVWQVFAESIAPPPMKFLSKECLSSANGTFTEATCTGKAVSMGFYADVTSTNRNPNITMNYFIKTNAAPPYSMKACLTEADRKKGRKGEL